jgi:hypothetical protein
MHGPVGFFSFSARSVSNIFNFISKGKNIYINYLIFIQEFYPIK